ncbi:MAG: hypothetical protein WBD40_16610 [Tepidisphaeraceae bacterium]
MPGPTHINAGIRLESVRSPTRHMDPPRDDEPAPKDSPAALGYYRPIRAPSEDWLGRAMPIVLSIVAASALAVSIFATSALSIILMLYLASVGLLLAFDGVRRPGRGWVVSLIGLILNGLLFALLLASLAWVM